MYGFEKILKGMLGSYLIPLKIKNKKIKALVHDAWGTPSSPSVGPMLYV